MTHDPNGITSRFCKAVKRLMFSCPLFCECREVNNVEKLNNTNKLLPAIYIDMFTCMQWHDNNNNNNNNTLIYIAPACRMTSEALADSSSRATECLTEK